MDKRRHYILILDTETANTFRGENGGLDTSNALAYDIGFAVCDTRGNIYEKHSFVNADIFLDYAEAMQSAYYAAKLPKYHADIKEGKRKLASAATIRREMLEIMAEYGIREVCAHNARFDMAALNATLRYLTKSRLRFWFPFGTTVWDSCLMAKDVILKMPTYKHFCEKNNILTATGRLPFNAQALYSYLQNDPEFIEAHTALEDALIEAKIVAYCFRQKKKMRKELWK